MQLVDDGPQEIGQAVAEAAGEIELGAATRLRDDRLPGLAEKSRR
jgi:hypothetical protein